MSDRLSIPNIPAMLDRVLTLNRVDSENKDGKPLNSLTNSAHFPTSERLIELFSLSFSNFPATTHHHHALTQLYILEIRLKPTHAFKPLHSFVTFPHPGIKLKLVKSENRCTTEKDRSALPEMGTRERRTSPALPEISWWASAQSGGFSFVCFFTFPSKISSFCLSAQIQPKLNLHNQSGLAVLPQANIPLAKQPGHRAPFAQTPTLSVLPCWTPQPPLVGMLLIYYVETHLFQWLSKQMRIEIRPLFWFYQEVMILNIICCHDSTH